MSTKLKKMEYLELFEPQTNNSRCVIRYYLIYSIKDYGYCSVACIDGGGQSGPWPVVK